MSSSTPLEQASKELQSARFYVHKLGQTFDSFQLHACSIHSLVEQWRNLEAGFSEVNGVLVNRVKEFESKERENVEVLNKLGIMKECLVLREKRLEAAEKAVKERVEAVEIREKDLKECYEVMELDKSDIEERRKAVASLEGRFMVELNGIGKVEMVKEREKKVEERERKVEEREREVERREEVDRRCEEEVEAEKVRVCELRVEVERREREIRKRWEEMEEEERELEERNRVLGVKEREMEVEAKEVEVRKEEVNQGLKMLERKEGLINKDRIAVEAKEEEVNRQQEELNVKEEELSEGLKWLEREKEVISEDRIAVEAKYEEVKKEQEELNVKEKELSEQMLINEHRTAVEAKEEEVNRQKEVFEAKEKELCEGLKKLERSRILVNEHRIAVEEKEREVERQKEALEVKEKKLSEGLKRLESGKEVISEDKTAVELSIVKGYCKELEANETEVNAGWERLKMKEEELNARCEAVELKDKGVDERFKAIEVKEKDLNELRQAVVIEIKEMGERGKAMELKEKEIGNHCGAMAIKTKQFSKQRTNEGLLLEEKQMIVHGQLREQKELQNNVPPATLVQTQVHDSSSMAKSAAILCRNMDAQGVISYLVKRLDVLTTIQEMFLDALKSASDPAKLVLDVCRCFHKKHSGKLYNARKYCCVFILEQFMILLPSVSPDVNNEAKDFAFDWISRATSDPTDNFAFLQFLVAYELAGLFNPFALLPRLNTLFSSADVYRPEQTFCLCSALGLVKDIEGHIRSLVKEQKWLLSVRFVCVFKLQSCFKVKDLLEAHIQFAKQIGEKKRKEGTSNAEVAANVELPRLRDMLKCVSNFNLQSEFPIDSLLLRIKSLEDIKNRKSRKRFASPSGSAAPFKSARKV